MKVLVTGANGMLGQVLCPVFEDNGLYVIPAGHKELDVTNYKTAKAAIENIMPQIIIHLAAYTNVDKAEEEFETAIKINKNGTKNIAKISKEINAIMVYISTDYVFDGEKNTPYTPADTPNPLNKYGLSKLEGEKAVQENTDKYYIVRTSWLYGPDNRPQGKNFVDTMLNLAQKNDEIKVVEDETGSPTYTIDLAMGILGIIGKPFGIYHISNEGETSRFNFAKEIFKLAGLNPELTPIQSKEYMTKAKRPKYSSLQNSIPIRHWAEALKGYIDYKESLNQ